MGIITTIINITRFAQRGSTGANTHPCRTCQMKTRCVAVDIDERTADIHCARCGTMVRSTRQLSPEQTEYLQESDEVVYTKPIADYYYD